MAALPLNWDDLQYFLAVARTGQLSRAAHALKSSHVTVGRHVDRLEEALGVALFLRGPKGYALTGEGVQLRDFVERMEVDTTRLPDLLAGTSEDIVGTVRLNMPEGLCSFFCAEILPLFRKRFPALSLELAAIQQISSFTPNAGDLSFLLESPRSSLFHAERVADYSLRVYGAADYLAQHPPITSRDDFLRHTFIGYIDGMVFMPSLDYLVEVAPKLRSALQFSSIFSQMRAVRSGLGLAVLPDFLAARHPELRPVMGDTVYLRRTYWLACRTDLRFAPREAAVIDMVKEQLGARSADLMQ